MISKEQLKELIKSIKSRTGLGQEQISLGAGYKKRTLTERLSGGDNLDAVYNQLQLVYGDALKKTMPGPEEKAKEREFSPSQLFAMFLEVSGKQTDILKSIESKMAREKTLADAGTNLNFVVASVKKISRIQDSGLKDLQEKIAKIERSQNDLSQDVRNKLDQNGGDDKTQGNHP